MAIGKGVDGTTVPTIMHQSRSPKILVLVAAVGAGAAWLAFGYFGVHTLFIDERVEEAVPVFDTPVAGAAETPTPAGEPDDRSAAPSSAPGPAEVAPDAAGSSTQDDATADDPTTDDATAEDPTTTSPPVPAAATEPVIEASGEFVSRDHPTSGSAVVLGNGSGQRFLRLEEFATDNGPDLNVYLVNSSTGDVSDYVDLGDLKGNIGDQNYEIPTDVDLERYDTVVIWCVRFGVPFGDAMLA